MAHADQIPVEILQKVAGELRDTVKKHLPSTSAEDGKANPLLPTGIAPGDSEQATIKLNLCETFTVWKLKKGTVEALNSPEFTGDLSDWVEPTEFLHHQVREKGELVAFARSHRGDGESSMSLSQYNISPLMSAMDSALDVIERNEEDEVAASDPVVRLLEIPSHHIVAFWLYAETLPTNRSRSVIVRAPTKISENYRGRLLTSAQFFGLLKESGVIRAITRDSGDDKELRDSHQF
jgi:hypothetical protein